MISATAERNPFFSIPIDIIRRRVHLPPPAPEQPGPFSLGDVGALEAADREAGFREIAIRTVAAPVRMASAAAYVRFADEAFGALHRMLAGLTETERVATWDEITRELGQFEGAERFVGPCEMIIGVGIKA